MNQSNIVFGVFRHRPLESSNLAAVLVTDSVIHEILEEAAGDGSSFDVAAFLALVQFDEFAQFWIPPVQVQSVQSN